MAGETYTTQYPIDVRPSEGKPALAKLVAQDAGHVERAMARNVLHVRAAEEHTLREAKYIMAARGEMEHQALDSLVELGHHAKEVVAAFDGDTDIDKVVRQGMMAMVIAGNDSRQRLIQGITQVMVDVATTDIRDNIPPEPPPAPPQREQVIIHQAAGPRYRRATLADLGRQKFVPED